MTRERREQAMAENFVSRIILQDGFSDTARKFKGASKGIVDADRKSVV